MQSYIDTILVNDLTTGGITKALTAEMGKVLKGLIDNLANNKEDKINKQNSLAVDGTNTKYPTVTAVNTGLSTKVTTTGTTGNLQRIVGTNQLGNSALTDNGTSVQSSLPLQLQEQLQEQQLLNMEHLQLTSY